MLFSPFSVNFGVPLWSKFFLKSFEILYAYQPTYKILICQNVRWFNIVYARKVRPNFARAKGENFAHSWFRTNSAFPRQLNSIIYEFNANSNEYKVAYSIHRYAYLNTMRKASDWFHSRYHFAFADGFSNSYHLLLFGKERHWQNGSGPTYPWLWVLVK